MISVDVSGRPAALTRMLGAERAARWSIDRGPYNPLVRLAGSADAPLAAVLTSSRPATATTKIVDLWWADGCRDDAIALVDAVIADAVRDGQAAVKWELPDDAELPDFAAARGFRALRPPYPSAAGTSGVRGGVRWLTAAPPREPGYYGQTTLFTCGAVAGLLAAELLGGEGFSGVDGDRALELAFWRLASNYPSCEPVGLAVALAERLGAEHATIEVTLDAAGPVLVEDFTGFEREFRELLQRDSRRRADALGIPVRPDRVAVAEIVRRVAAGELALLLIDEAPMHAETAPHWILAHAVVDDVVIVQDPWIDSAHGETWVDAHELAVPAAELDRMVAWGDEGYRGVVFLRGAEG